MFNYTGGNGGGIYNRHSLNRISFVNCIIWGNIAVGDGDQIYQDPVYSSDDTFTYSCIQDWTGGGTGNTSTAPLFMDVPDSVGFWTDNAFYDTETFQTMLTNTNALWDTDTLVGNCINPDTAQYLQFVIDSNTDTTITVWGDASALGLSGNSYRIYDYHLQFTSPCLDAGDNTVSVGFEDVEGNFRYVNNTSKPGWGEKIIHMFFDESDSFTLIWKGLIDMGAYECQNVVPTYETFTLLSKNDITDSWQTVFVGNESMWTDTQTVGVKQRFYRVWGE